MTNTEISPEMRRIAEARHHDPFAVLGKHPSDEGVVVRAFIPHATEVAIAEGNLPMARILDSDFFEWRGAADVLPDHYRFIWRDTWHHEHIAHDPYCFLPQLGDLDLHLFGEGRHWHAYRFLGAHGHEVAGVAGALFAVWAPNAERVSVLGDFNHWDGRRHPMRGRGSSGVWELFIPNLGAGTVYKYEIRNRHTGSVETKADPYGSSEYWP